MLHTGSAAQGHRQRSLHSWGVSLCVHLVTALLAGLWSFSEILPVDTPPLDATWAPPTISQPLTTSEFKLTEETTEQGGGSGQSAEFLATTVLVERGARLSEVVAPAATMDFDNSPLRPRGRSRASRVSNDSRSASAGQNSAPGLGWGEGTGFFGLPVDAGQTIVFVVDNSRSMNHPHDSPAKTRYRRLKYELVKCILEMHSDQSFYVVFFSNEMNPMPARGLQPALDVFRRPLLQWIAAFPSGGGPTEPLPALELGLRLRPDVLCFLTDGSFHSGINRKLLSISQRSTAIHTFAFGNTEAEETLRQLAEHNRGEYRFIP